MPVVHRIHTPYNDDYPSQLMDPAPRTNPDDPLRLEDEK